MKTETQIQSEICEWLHLEGYTFWRCNNIPVRGRGGFMMRKLPKFTPAGLPDIMMVHEGKFYGIEVKRPAGTDLERELNGRKVRAGQLSDAQKDFGTKISLAGGHYLVVNSLEDLVFSIK